MLQASDTIDFVIMPLREIALKPLSAIRNTLVFFTKEQISGYFETLNIEALEHKILSTKHTNAITDVAFIAKDDIFSYKELQNSLTQIFETGIHHSLTLLVPYLVPPLNSQRSDGKVQSALVSFNLTEWHKPLDNFWKIVYQITYNYLNTVESHNLEVVQVGKPLPDLSQSTDTCESELEKSLLVIPHKGSVKLLNRSLLHLNQTPLCPATINLCFDDNSYKKINFNNYNQLKPVLKTYLNVPGNVGPYLPRHYSILNSKNDFVFFQDSDDISVKTRFVKQLNELKTRGLDMMGSHELRVDQFVKSVLIMRNPLVVQKIDSVKMFYPLFHPTSLITREAYLKAKGFSTDRRFGLDYQFLLRCCFMLKMGNIDDFLYIRFRRSNSLTTSSATKMGSSVRSFFKWRWIVDFELVNEDKLDLVDSSLWVKHHEFDYQLTELTSLIINE